MADTKTPSPPSSSAPSSPRQTSSHSHPFLLFILLLFIFLLLAHPADQIRHSSMISESFTQTLATTSAGTSSFSATSTSSFRPKDHALRGKTLPSKDHQFEGDEHEVPSGPNPISNR